MSTRLLLVLWLAIGGPLAAQSAAGRWSLQVRGPVGVDRGDLRIAGDSATLLLESRDSSWLVMPVRTGAGRITFTPPGGPRFVGTIGLGVMSGTIEDRDSIPGSWEARQIQPGIEEWPVRPRITVRQLVIGRDDSMAVISDAWRSRTLPQPALLAEHAALATEAGFPPADLEGIAARAQRIVLGFDADGRAAARRLLEKVAASPAADREFQGIFRAPDGRWRLDIHDVAWQLAAQQVGPAPLARDSVAAMLATLGALADPAADSVAVVRATWLLWERHRTEPGLLRALLAPDVPPTHPGQRALRALIVSYDAAEGWWLQATGWLLEHRWIATDSGMVSPRDLVARFWERDALPVPALQPRYFGVVQAVPVIGAAVLGRRLLRPDNAIAAEFLDSLMGRRESMAAWRRLDFPEPVPLRITVGPQTMSLGSPAAIARSRLGGFLAADDAIRIEPGIMPVFAVGTVVHEWQHLLFEAARLSGPGTPGVRDAEWGLRLVEADPWLGEGAAEWATEQVLAPASQMTPLFALIEAEKRLAIGRGLPDDTHVLGYLLVRAAMNRVGSRDELRRLLVARLHDPVGLAATIGLAGPATVRIPRPQTLVVIPEVTFTIDGGVADGTVRRLIVPALPVEP